MSLTLEDQRFFVQQIYKNKLKYTKKLIKINITSEFGRVLVPSLSVV
jgi:hypothetical protein